ncbi:flagellar hook-length control protein FliK [Nocardioides sp. SYSU DS0651]|uniref:flagellar hook-length control protein FliK n=1 Tax=Nocardioides sp. SYSU DS0651 TaxID=3415955 RepID=UPI003F4B7920
MGPRQHGAATAAPGTASSEPAAFGPAGGPATGRLPLETASVGGPTGDPSYDELAGPAASRAATATGPGSTGPSADSISATTNSAVATPNSAVASASSAGGNPNSGSGVQRAVVQQVFPEVTRLSTTGNGAHRITLSLQPAQLGEVRVTLVVRDGAVTVSLGGEAGNSAVQQALSSGASELRRMLELAGATDARIFVRDAQSGTAASQGSHQQTGQQLGQQLSQHADQQPGQGAGAARQDAEARDRRQGRDQQPHPAAPSRPGAADGVAGTTQPRTTASGRLDRSL